MREIEINNLSNEKFLPKKKLEDTVNNVLSGENIENANIKIFILSNEEIHEMNKEYLNHDYPTDVISFSLGEDGEVEGQVYIGAGVAKNQASEYKVSLTNELKRLTAHGTLHVLGYDDSTDEDREKMHELENKYMA